MALAKYRDPATGAWKYVDVPPHHHDSRYPQFQYVDDADQADRDYADIQDEEHSLADRAHADAKASERLRWRGEYVDSTQYLANDVVRIGGETMVALVDTSEAPSPLSTDWEVLASGGDSSYTHVQEMPAMVWNVEHGLGKRPSVSVQDAAGNLIHGEVSYLDADSLTISFQFVITGRADCN